MACELIDDNGKKLQECVLNYADQWELPKEFIAWVKTENIFCSTLVDRIVTGYPHKEAEEIQKELGYRDNILNTGEIFGFWVIEGPESLKRELPFAEAGLPVLITQDHKPYKQRKVRILNGAHTSMVLGAYLAGQDIVRDCMEDEIIREFMNQTIYNEIIPTLDLPEKELLDFAKAVTDRFENPFINHSLLSISLNTTSKWRARVLPSLKGYIRKFSDLPKGITASLAFYIAFYHGVRLEKEGLVGKRGETEYLIKDDQEVLEFYNRYKDCDMEELAEPVLKNTDFWGEDLTQINGLCDEIVKDLTIIKTEGAYQLMKECLKKSR